MDISTRNTKSNKIPELDSLYVYQTKHDTKFHKHLNKGVGYRYTLKNAIVKAGEDEIYDYHQSAEIFGIKQAIVLVTKNSNGKQVQKWFKEQITLIEENDALFDKYAQAKSYPTELGISYLY